jgi:hypothetical protein
MGYYGGDGGRFMASLTNLTGIDQVMPTADHETGLMECNWVMPSTGPYQWVTPAVSRNSGAYIAKLTVNVPGQGDKSSYISFVVRDDARVSAYLFQTSVTTYQAYNFWPRDVAINPPTTTEWHQGKSLYAGSAQFPLSWGPEIPVNHENGKQARKVSFNRPYATDQLSVYPTAGQFFTHGEYNMVRFMEMKKMDVTYTTDVDTDSDTALTGPLSPGRHQVFLSVGHDEYWSWRMRDNIEKARDRTNQPLNIGWFGANDVHWQIRFEDSSTGAEKRTIVAYKHLAASSDFFQKDPLFKPSDEGWSPNNYLTTNLWRDNNPATLGPRCPGEPTIPDCYKPPEDELVGVMTTTPNTVTGRGDFYLKMSTCPAFVKRGVAQSRLAFYNLVGYEADEIFNRYEDPGDEHPRLFYQVGDSTLYCQEENCTASTDSHAVYYELLGNGARVFAAGSVSWGWGVDPFGEPQGPAYSGPSFLQHPATFNQRIQVMTSNILLCLRDGGNEACKIE